MCEGRNDAARWREGDNVLLRHVGSAKTYVWPHTVVRDEGDVVLMYIPEGTKILRARTGGSPPELMPSFTRSLAEKWKKGSILLAIHDGGERSCWESDLSREAYGRPTGCT